MVDTDSGEEKKKATGQTLGKYTNVKKLKQDEKMAASTTLEWLGMVLIKDSSKERAHPTQIPGWIL